MASLTPHPGQRTRDNITYGDVMRDETLEVASTFNGAVTIDDAASSFHIILTPEKARALGQAITKAARWAADARKPDAAS